MIYSTERGLVIFERIERRRGLRWLLAKLFGRPTRCRVTERLTAGRCTTLRDWLA